ncbi:uncharacterized protein LOC111126841 [Crassostrea virginica]
MSLNRINIPIGRTCRPRLLFFALLIVVIVESTLSSALQNQGENELDTDFLAPKRYAMMSYGYGSPGGQRPAYRYSGNRQSSRVTSYLRPWEQLPDYKCYRKRCATSADCCRRYNVCDSQVKVCYDCWYGYNCQSSRDCCQRYPYCHPRKKICYN